MLRRLPVEVRVEVTEKVQQLHHRHPVGEVGALRQIGYQPPGVRAGGLAVDEQLPRRGGQKPIGDLQQRGLTAAVGAKQTHDPPRLQPEGQVVQPQRPVVIFGQVLTF